MAYTTLADVKDYLDIQTTADDALITSLIAQAEQAIDTYTHRHFEAVGDVKRYFDGVLDTDGRELFLDEDLASFSEVKNNGTVLTFPTDFVTVPRNEAPYDRLRLVCNNFNGWCGSTLNCSTDSVEITGEWVYSLTPPQDIVHATIRLTGFYYRQKDSQVFSEITILEAGVITAPPSIPADVIAIITPYRKAAT